MTKASPAELRSPLYEAYATQHSGCGGDKAAALVNRRDIRPLLASMGGHAAAWTQRAFAPERYAQLAVRRLL